MVDCHRGGAVEDRGPVLVAPALVAGGEGSWDSPAALDWAWEDRGSGFGDRCRLAAEYNGYTWLHHLPIRI